MAREELGHRQHVAGLRAAALEVAVLQMRRRDLQRVPDPLPRRKARPAVGRPGRRMRTSIHEHGAVQGPHELQVVGANFARERILFLENARASEAAPLMGSRMRAALILWRSPDRLRGGVGTLATGLIEWNPCIVAQGRLRRRIRLVVFLTPFAGDIGRNHRAGGPPLSQHANADQRRRSK